MNKFTELTTYTCVCMHICNFFIIKMRTLEIDSIYSNNLESPSRDQYFAFLRRSSTDHEDVLLVLCEKKLLVNILPIN